jgi:hypothetical protein
MKRVFLIIGALAGWFAVLLQYYIAMTVADSRLAETIRFLSFMTIWTNVIVALFYTVSLLAPKSKLGRFFSKPMVQAGLLLYIIIVGLIYHLLLAKQWNPQGWEYIADQSLHTVVPVLFLFYWMLFADKEKLNMKSVLRWMIYPLVYVVYSLIRGAITGKYPYFFVDVSKLGYPTAMRNVSFVMAAYFVLGIVLVLVNNLMTGKKNVEQ